MFSQLHPIFLSQPDERIADIRSNENIQLLFRHLLKDSGFDFEFIFEGQASGQDENVDIPPLAESSVREPKR